MKDYFSRLIQYDHWANSSLLSFLESRNIKDDQIQKLLSHVLNAEYIWYSRLIGNAEPGKKVWEVHSFERLTELVDEIHLKFQKFFEDLSLDAFARIVDYKNSEGKSFSNSVQDILAHLINHGSYHRGQINQLIRKKNLDPPVLDYIVFMRS